MTSLSQQPPRSNRYLYAAVFTSGMTTLAVEMTASRLLGSVFGTSNLVWANVIGLIMLYLAVGYFAGGRLADKSPQPASFYRLLLWGAFLSALVPLAARPVLSTATRAVSGIEAGLFLGSFASVLALFAIPITILGMVSPFAIRLAVTDVTTAGKVSGRIYAISTIGSLLGTFLPVVLIIPELGTFGTFLLFAGILFTVALIGLISQRGLRALGYLWMPIVVAVLSLIAANTPLRSPASNARILYEDESAYNYIQVQEDDQGNRYLYLNEGEGIHSQWNARQVTFGRTWDFFLSAPYFNAPPYAPDRVHNLLLIGLAAGTIARQYTYVYDNIPIDGIEIDPGIVEAGARYFDMNVTSMPNLTVHVEDGRYALNQLQQTYSVIGIDAYRPPYIPWHLTTVEFFEEVRAHLTDDGVVAINVGRTHTDRRLVDALTATLLQVFPSVHAMDVPQSFNTILVATMQPTSSDDLALNAVGLPPETNFVLRDTLALAAASVVPAQASDLIFTDDRAPVETLVDSLVLGFLLSDDADSLRGG
ncbi:MAG: fused MFS/spermidine synthase [Anaerolineae bacterium]